MLPGRALSHHLYVEGTERTVDSGAGLPNGKERAEWEGGRQPLLGTHSLTWLTSPTQDVGEAGPAASRQQ